MKKFMKMAFAVVALVAVGLGSYKAYGSYTAANMSEEDLLMAENVLALSDPGGNKDNYTQVKDQSVTCYVYGYTISKKLYDAKKKRYYKTKSWDYQLKGYRWKCKEDKKSTPNCNPQKTSCKDEFGDAPANHEYYESRNGLSVYSETIWL